MAPRSQIAVPYLIFYLNTIFSWFNNHTFRSVPLLYPPRLWSAFKMRWHGMTIANGFRPQALATARKLLGFPIAWASPVWELALPYLMRWIWCQTDRWNSVSFGSTWSGVSNTQRFPWKYWLNSFSIDSRGLASWKAIDPLRCSWSRSCFRCLLPAYVSSNKCVSLLTASIVPIGVSIVLALNTASFVDDSFPGGCSRLPINSKSLSAPMAVTVERCDGFSNCLNLVAMALMSVHAQMGLAGKSRIAGNF